jgi:hypothetical protein
MEEKYIYVCCNPEIIEDIHNKSIHTDTKKLNDYIENIIIDENSKPFDFDPYRFLANYSENSSHYKINYKEFDIIKICHCWIVYGYMNGLKISHLNSKECLTLLNSPKICFITSMTKQMYNMYGSTMINDLVKYTKTLHSCFVVYSENFEFTQENVFFQSLANDSWLNDWITTNKDIIPIEYGGSFKEKMGPFKYNASKFIKKVASLNCAINTFDYDYYIWIDCDCTITNDITYDLINTSFSNCNFFYHHGKNREKKAFGIETGCFGFDKQGIHAIHKWCEFYKSQNFKRLRRWDDGFILRHVIHKKYYAKNKSIVEFKDLVPNATDWVYPLKSSIWNNVLQHNKGDHYRNNIHRNVKNM